MINYMRNLKDIIESLLDINDINDQTDPIDIIFTAKSERDFLELQKMYLGTLKSKKVSDWDEIDDGEFIIFELFFNDFPYGMEITKKGYEKSMTIQFLHGSKKVGDPNIRRKKNEALKNSKTVYFITKKEFDKFKKHVSK